MLTRETNIPIKLIISLMISVMLNFYALLKCTNYYNVEFLKILDSNI